MRDNAVVRLAAGVAEVVGAEVTLERPSDPAHGDYATNVALRLAGGQRRPPRELAEELAAKVTELEDIERVEVAGPGFLNLFVTDAFLARALEEIGDGYGAGSAAKHERVNVEMVSANPTGPIPVSAARNGAYGDSVARLARVRRPRRRARVLLQQRGPPARALPRLCRGGPARGGPAAPRVTRASTSASSRRVRETRCKRC